MGLHEIEKEVREITMVYHCLFEQSGTFKNELKKLGCEAYDYDILDDFGETDFKIDLYSEIEVEYSREREREYLLKVGEGGHNSCLLPLHSVREPSLALLPR